MPRLREPEAFAASAGTGSFCLRFERIDGRILVTNMVGEHLMLSGEDFGRLAERALA